MNGINGTNGINGLKELYRESCLSRMVYLLMNRIIPYVRQQLLESRVWRLWLWFERAVLNFPLVRIFWDTPYTAEIWYKSRFYGFLTAHTEKITRRMGQSAIAYDCGFAAVFLGAVILLPDRLWNGFFFVPALIGLSIFYISCNARNRSGTMFMIICSVVFVFIVLFLLLFPLSTVTTLFCLLLSFIFFFLVSFSVKSRDDLEKFMLIIFGAAAILCTIGFVQNLVTDKAATAYFADSVRFGEIIILMFPFAFTYPMEYVHRRRRYLYAGFIFIIAFNAIVATRSRAAYIGFLIELAILLITDKKHAPFIIILIPLGLGSLAGNLREALAATTRHGNVITNVTSLFKNFWDFGFGVNTDRFMAIYNSVSPDRGGGVFSNIINVSPVYINFIIDIGAVILIVFLIYILKIAHSALTSLLFGDKRYKKLSAAGLAMLIGLSVSSFFESTMFDPRIMLIYWAMIGMLRSVRIMNLSAVGADEGDGEPGNFNNKK